jgi:hypothetical protein
MESTAASAQAPPAGPAAPAPGWRLAGVLALGLAVAGLAWFGLRSRAAGGDPVALFDHVRSRVLAGDAEAAWAVMLPEARERYVEFLRMAAGQDTAGGREWMRRVGVSPKEMVSLPPEKVLAREFTAYAEEFFRHSRARSEPISEDEALLQISMGNGDDRQWLVQRVDGVWKIKNLRPIIDARRVLHERPGQPGRQLPPPPGGEK